MTYPKNPISSVNEDLLLKNQYYQKYLKQKKEIQSRYPQEMWEYPLSRTKYNREMWKQYLKEIGDLMYTKEGWFQQFIWDSYSESDKELMERKARSNKQGVRLTDFNYY